MEQKQVRCPKCGTVQPFGDKCVSCGLDFKEYARRLREKRAAGGAAEGKTQKKVRCPECKTVQPLGDKCVSCGLDFKEYARRLREKREAAGAGETAKEAEPPKAEEKTEEKAGEEKAPPKARPEKPWEKKTPVDIKIPVLPVEPTLSSIDDLLNNTWIIYKSRLLTLVSLYLLSYAAFIVPFVAAVFIGGVIAATVPGVGIFAAYGASALGALVAIVAWFWVFGGFISACCDETQKFSEALGSGWKNVWSFLWLYLIAGYIIGGGFFFFIIPGIVMMVWFFAAQFILFEEGGKGISAMLKSKAYVSGFGGGVFGRLVLIALFAVIASLVPLVGGILFTPFMMIYMVHLYRDLRSLKGKDVRYDASSGTKAVWIVIGTVGYVVPIALGLLVFGLAAINSLKGMDVSSFRQFAVGGAMVTTEKQTYAPHEPVELVYAGLPGNAQDWISVVRETEPENTYGEWFYTGGATEGTRTLPGFPPGNYEARVYFDWPKGGYIVHARHKFRVEGAVGPGADIKPELKLDVISFAPESTITVRFKAPSTYPPKAWVGIVPSSVPHGSGAENDRFDVAFEYLNGRTSGEIYFVAPTPPGIYDVRMFDASGNGSEVASVTFAVEGR